MHSGPLATADPSAGFLAAPAPDRMRALLAEAGTVTMPDAAAGTSTAPPSRDQRIALLARLEWLESLRSRWLQFVAVVYLLVFGAFIWLGLRESSVLGFTGLSRVVLNVANATVIAVPLVALVATCQAITKARATGHLELLFSQPVRPADWLVALVVSRAAVLLGPLALLLACTAAVALVTGTADSTLAPMIVHALAVASSLVVCYLGIGLLLSALARTLEHAVVLALVAWLVSAALHDFALIGVLLQWRVPPEAVFALAAVNPVEAARIAVLASVDPELSVLGPVGFWIANTLGPANAYFFGLAWPALVGFVCLLVTARLVRRGDAVR
jgi:ABC-2 type transport system permease protein